MYIYKQYKPITGITLQCVPNFSNIHIVLDGLISVTGEVEIAPSSFIETQEQTLQPTKIPLTAWLEISKPEMNAEALRGRPSTIYCGGEEILQGGFDSGLYYISNDLYTQHKSIRLTGKISAIDVWEGEAIYIKVNEDHIIWLDTFRTYNKDGFSMCGDPSLADAGINHVVDVTFPHTGDTLEVYISSTLSETNDALFGISHMYIELI